MPAMLSEDIADAVVYVLSTPPHVQVMQKLYEQVTRLLTMFNTFLGEGVDNKACR